jgi:ABC-2 type transport system permease protein
MDKLWVIIRREFVERVQTRWFLLATIFGPLLLGMIMFVPPWLTRNSVPSADVARIAVLDATGTDLGRRIAFELAGGVMGDTNQTQVIALKPANVPMEESRAMQWVVDGRVLGYLVLDSMTLAGRNARYAGRNASSPADVSRIERIIREQVMRVRLERGGLTAQQAQSVASMRLRLDAERITDRGRGEPGEVSMIFAFGVAFLLYISIFIYGQNVLRGVSEEKQTRVAEVIMSSVRPTVLLAGKVLGVGAVGLTQLIIWLGASFAMRQIRLAVLEHFGIPVQPFPLPHVTPGMWVVLLLFFLLGYTFYAALFAAVGATLSSEHDAQQAQLPVVALLISTILLIPPVLARPDGPLAKLLSGLPFSAPIIMPLRLSVVQLPAAEIALSLLVVFAGCYIAVFIAARIYRVGMLMYGKRPGVREMARWLTRAR